MLGATTQAAMVAAVLFGVVGTTDWPRGWVFVAAWSVNVFVVGRLLRDGSAGDDASTGRVRHRLVPGVW